MSEVAVDTRKWICRTCNWIYDEAVGMPEDGIPLSPEHFDNYFLLLVVAAVLTLWSMVSYLKVAWPELRRGHTP